MHVFAFPILLLSKHTLTFIFIEQLAYGSRDKGYLKMNSLQNDFSNRYLFQFELEACAISWQEINENALLLL